MLVRGAHTHTRTHTHTHTCCERSIYTHTCKCVKHTHTCCARSIYTRMCKCVKHTHIHTHTHHSTLVHIHAGDTMTNDDPSGPHLCEAAAATTLATTHTIALLSSHCHAPSVALPHTHMAPHENGALHPPQAHTAQHQFSSSNSAADIGGTQLQQCVQQQLIGATARHVTASATAGGARLLACTGTHTHMFTHMYAHSHTQKCMHTCTQAPSHTYIHTYIHTCTHTFAFCYLAMHMRVYTYTHILTRTQRCNTYTGAHKHAHSCTHTHVHRCNTHRCNAHTQIRPHTNTHRSNARW